VLLLLTQVLARLAEAGNARLRKALYLPTLTAIRFNPLLGGFLSGWWRRARRGWPRWGRACASR
jgi:hypothetical protein